ASARCRSGLDFAFVPQARRGQQAESRSSSYGLIVRRRLLPTPSHDDAVAFGYRPESACLKRTFTSLLICAHRRTVRVASSAQSWWGGVYRKRWVFPPRLRAGSDAYPGRVSRFLHRLHFKWLIVFSFNLHTLHLFGR